MSKPEQVDEHRADGGARRSISFRKRRNAPPLTPAQLRRQGDLVTAAWRHFQEAAPMIAFLNSRHDALDGQPLHLAIGSDEGLARVERHLQQLSA
jgi:hypothetical protein